MTPKQAERYFTRQATAYRNMPYGRQLRTRYLIRLPDNSPTVLTAGTRAELRREFDAAVGAKGA